MFRILLILVLAFQGLAALGADGIPANVPFKIPYQVGDQSHSARAVVVIASDGVATMRINYWTGESVEETVYTITRKDGPVPPPPPPPVAELWGVIIEESSERTAEQAVVYASPKVRDLFKDGEFRIIDKDTETSPDMRPYVERAKGDKLPVLYLVDLKGTVYYEGPPPATVEAMVALVQKHKTKGGAH